MSTHNICFHAEVLLMSSHNILFLWRNEKKIFIWIAIAPDKALFFQPKRADTMHFFFILQKNMLWVLIGIFVNFPTKSCC